MVLCEERLMGMYRRGYIWGVTVEGLLKGLFLCEGLPMGATAEATYG